MVPRLAYALPTIFKLPSVEKSIFELLLPAKISNALVPLSDTICGIEPVLSASNRVSGLVVPIPTFPLKAATPPLIVLGSYPTPRLVATCKLSSVLRMLVPLLYKLVSVPK